MQIGSCVQVSWKTVTDRRKQGLPPHFFFDRFLSPAHLRRFKLNAAEDEENVYVQWKKSRSVIMPDWGRFQSCFHIDDVDQVLRGRTKS